MAVPILYCQAYPNPANSGGDGGQIACFADDGSATHLTVLATVGGVLTFTLTSRGSGFTSGTYPNIPIITTGAPLGPGNAGTVTVGVSATGQITVVTPFIPGYGYALQNFGFNLTNAAFATPSSTLATIAIASVIPCSAPAPVNTRFIEIECDSNGPVYITLDSTLTSLGITNGILTTEQSTLATAACRLTSNERLVRALNPIVVPTGGYGAGFALPLALQVIMGTAAA